MDAASQHCRHFDARSASHPSQVLPPVAVTQFASAQASMQAVNQDEVEHNLLLQSYRLMHRTVLIRNPLQALLGAKLIGALVLLILVGRRTHAGTRRQIADKLNLSMPCSGLGLSIVRQIALAMGEAISVNRQ